MSVYLLTIFLSGEPLIGPFDMKDMAACYDTGAAIVDIVRTKLEPLLRGREVTWTCEDPGAHV